MVVLLLLHEFILQGNENMPLSREHRARCGVSIPSLWALLQKGGTCSGVSSCVHLSSSCCGPVILSSSLWKVSGVSFRSCLNSILRGHNVLCLLSGVQLFATLWTVARQAPLSTGIFQAKMLEWVTMPLSRGSSQPRARTQFPTLQADSLPSEPPGKPNWCWSWNSNTLATWWKEMTHWKRPWFWEIVKAGWEGDDRGWDGWMAPPNRLTWVWISSRSWCWTGKPDGLQSMESQRVGYDWGFSFPKFRLGHREIACHQWTVL